MKIKLIRSGGFIPVIKAAEADVDISVREMEGLLEIIHHDPAAPKLKDGNSWELTIGRKSIAVDLEKVPDEYKAIFDQLKNDLKIVK